MQFPNPFILGSRSSPLALLQTELVKQEIITAFPDQYTTENIVIKTFKTTGDKILDQRLVDFGGKGLFTKELEEALFKEEIHGAVHSMKDMATKLPDGLAIKAYLKRENPADVLISNGHLKLEDLPKGAIAGTASLRRAAQLLNVRPDLKIKLIRGNIDTRLEKLAQGEYDTIILAYAGLIRRNMQDIATEVLSNDLFLPAVGQGVICIEAKSYSALDHIFQAIHDSRGSILVDIERQFLKIMDGSCKTALAGHARRKNEDEIHFRGEVYRSDGSEKFSINENFSVENSIEKITKLSETLRVNLPSDIFLYE